MKIKVDKKYPLEVVFSACCWFLDNYYILVDSKKENFEILFKSKKKGKMTNKTKDNFLEKLEEFNIYFNVDKKNKKLREYIIGQALFPVMDIPETEKDQSEVVAVPWDK